MPFKEATFWWGTIVGGTGIYFWVQGGERMTAGIILTIAGLLLSAYAVISHYKPQLPKLPMWVAGMVLTLAGLGYDYYDRHTTPDYKTWRSSKEETIYAKSFINETVELDGKKFDRCNFENVKLLYHGLAPVEFVGGTFKGSIWFGSDNIAVNQFEIDRSFFDQIKTLFPAARWIQTDPNGNPISVQ